MVGATKGKVGLGVRAMLSFFGLGGFSNFSVWPKALKLLRFLGEHQNPRW